jgi:NADH-quinone oxidoreductase subunit L
MDLLENLFPADDFTLVPIILGLPLVGAFINGIFGKRLGKDAVRLMALSAIGISFLASLLAFAMLVHQSGGEGHEGAEVFKFVAWRWFDVSTQSGSGTTSLDVAFMIDHLSAVMMLVITGVGFLIHLYASAYMWDDDRPDGGFHRFFAYLNLFCFAMLVLVMGASLPILFVGWEGVGLCSYLLIGFWYSDDANAAAGKKAFIANRIGDFGLLVAMSLLLAYTGALDWDGIGAGSGSLLQRVQVWPIGVPPPWIQAHLGFLAHPVMPTVATVVGLSLFLGCAGKSAQIPLYVWLPDAMAGPTPVSALIHAATMVTAGVYLVCRLSGVFLLSPVVMAVVAATGALTALFAATIGLAQTDIKKVLAYSTVSQLGYMFLGVGVGAFSAGFFHVFTHAFFKACLFLGAGSVIHAMHTGIHDSQASQDMRNMGGLRKYLPLTFWTFLASCIAIAGFPPTSGFFSKDEILYRAYANHISALPIPGEGARWEAPAWFGPMLYWMGIIAAAMTAFYMFRALFLTFFGEFRGWKIDPSMAVAHGHHGHEHNGHDHDDHALDEHAGHAHPAASSLATEPPHAEQADVHGHGGHGHPSVAPAPHESPAAMTWPLIVLGFFALVAGFFNPGLPGIPGSNAPLMEKWLEPVFAGTEQLVRLRDGAPSAWITAVPGILVAFIGAGGAYFVYQLQRGLPAKLFTEKVPALYQLVLDKWRIDELYEATIIGAVDSLAETAALFDKWFIDGILARLTSLIVSALGSILRAAQTGVVHAYAAIMVLGIAVFGWFFVWHPQARATVREEASGKFLVEASPGLGYAYRWHSRTPDSADSDAFGQRHSVVVDVAAGENKVVKVEVRNAFGRIATETVTVSRPAGPAPHPEHANLDLNGVVR